MMKYRSAGGVSALGGYVYALGGHDGLSIFDSVERKFISLLNRIALTEEKICSGYDPVTNTWTKVVPMLNRRCRLGVATLNGKLYACGGKYLNTACPTYSTNSKSIRPQRIRWQSIFTIG